MRNYTEGYYAYTDLGMVSLHNLFHNPVPQFCGATLLRRIFLARRMGNMHEALVASHTFAAEMLLSFYISEDFRRFRDKIKTCVL